MFTKVEQIVSQDQIFCGTQSFFVPYMDIRRHFGLSRIFASFAERRSARKAESNHTTSATTNRTISNGWHQSFLLILYVEVV